MDSKGMRGLLDNLIHVFTDWWYKREDWKKVLIITILALSLYVGIMAAITPSQSDTTTNPDVLYGGNYTFDNTKTETNTTTTQNGGQKDKAISTVKNYGNGWTTIGQALESVTHTSEESGNYISGGTWTAEAIDSSNYKVTYNVQENGETVEAIFKVDLDTGMVTGMNKLGEDTVATAET